MKKLIITLFTLLLLSATVFAGVEQNLNDRIEQIEDRIEELQDELKKYGNKKFRITENDKMKVDPSRSFGGKAEFSFLKIEFNLKTIKPIFTYIGGKTLKYYKKALRAFEDHPDYSMKRYRKLFKNIRYATFYFNQYLKKEENRKKLEEYLNNISLKIKKEIQSLAVLKNKIIEKREKEYRDKVGNRGLLFASFNFHIGSSRQLDISFGAGIWIFAFPDARKIFNMGLSLNANYMLLQYVKNGKDYSTSDNGSYINLNINLVFKVGRYHSFILVNGFDYCKKIAGSSYFELRDKYQGLNVELGYLYLKRDLSYGLYFAFYFKLMSYEKADPNLNISESDTPMDFFLGLKFTFLLNLTKK